MLFYNIVTTNISIYIYMYIYICIQYIYIYIYNIYIYIYIYVLRPLPELRVGDWSIVLSHGLMDTTVCVTELAGRSLYMTCRHRPYK